MSIVAQIRHFLLDRQGSFAVPTTLLLVPMIGAIALALEIGHLSQIRDKLQADLDRALTAALEDHGDVSPEMAFATAKRAMEQTAASDAPYVLGEFRMSALPGNVGFAAEVSASAREGMGFIGMFGMSESFLNARSEFRASDTGGLHYEVSLIIDKTMSMLEPATQEGMNVLRPVASLALNNCHVACHTITNARSYGDQLTLAAVVNGKTFASPYVYARSRNVVLRADIQDQAAKAIVETLEGLDPKRERIRLGLYTFGASVPYVDFMRSLTYPDYPDEHRYRVEQSLTQVVPPTLDILQVRRTFAANPALDPSLGHTLSDFRALTTLPRFVGKQGDGSTPDRPKRLVILITDGYQTQMDMPRMERSLMGPMNPDWCRPVKDQGVDLIVLGIDYLQPIPHPILTYNLAMKGIYPSFIDTWQSDLSLDKSVPKASLLKPALTACASTPESYMPASDTDRIRRFLTDAITRSGPPDGSWYLSK